MRRFAVVAFVIAAVAFAHRTTKQPSSERAPMTTCVVLNNLVHHVFPENRELVRASRR
jgi:hypothetical protein